MTDRIVFAKANGWEDTLMAQEWGVRGYPTLILMNADGTEIDRIPGYMPPQDFIETIDNYAQGIGTLDDLLAKFEDNPDSLQLCLEIGEKYQYRAEDSLSDVFYAMVMSKDPGNKSDLADDAGFRIALNKYYGGEEMYDEAIAAFNAVVEKYPQSDMGEEAATYIPYILARQGKDAQALQLYQQFLKDYPESGESGWVRSQIEKLTEQES